MAQQVTIYEGIGKDSKKPFKALRVEVGEFSKLVFLDNINIAYLEQHLEKYVKPEPKNKEVSVESQVDPDSTFLED